MRTKLTSKVWRMAKVNGENKVKIDGTEQDKDRKDKKNGVRAVYKFGG